MCTRNKSNKTKVPRALKFMKQNLYHIHIRDYKKSKICLQAIFIMTKTTCTILKRPEFDIFFNIYFRYLRKNTRLL